MRSLLAIGFRILFRIKYLKPTYFGFYKRLFKPFCLFKGVRKTILYRNDIELKLDIEDWIQQNLYFLDEYEEKEIEFLEYYLKRGDIFIDLGANIGLFSLVASRLVGEEGKIYSFEPNPASFYSLTHHIKINRASNVIAENLAIADKTGVIQLYINEQEKNTGGATTFPDRFSKSQSVRVTSLDTYFSNKVLHSLALIKLDIEGGEFSALLGMENILRKFKPALLIELDSDVLKRTPYKGEDIEYMLQQFGYRKFGFNPDQKFPSKGRKKYASNNYIFLCDASNTFVRELNLV